MCGNDLFRTIESPPMCFFDESNRYFLQFNCGFTLDNEYHRVVGWAHPELIVLEEIYISILVVLDASDLSEYTVLDHYGITSKIQYILLFLSGSHVGSGSSMDRKKIYLNNI
jgi:hypothetical protein